MISEKTVSSHVSNLLRKTHTSSRVELAQLAHRVVQNLSSHPAARSRLTRGLL